ncbi:hypothetical protein BEL04_18840 [Mucilaginibacter sp. PPCGB 2223]|uniref:sensor histidine kinase n=1 Tax=Mucilaginibacter sp. PPCGB 2223 TaxID=1886027 RepID=UPI00082459DF|nr:histidine kinase [Mucilaginibacter sp. PPCGB 2223]OCX50790.1 hypothetical protein BEL04_18840 [Mucilaginibacter sp. PPCGB 2223]
MSQITYRPWFYKIAPLLIWLLLVVMPLFTGPGNMPAEIHHRFWLHTFQNNIFTLVLFYCHTYLVYPLLSSKKQWTYWPALALLLIIYVLAFGQLVTPFNPHLHDMPGAGQHAPPPNFDQHPPFGFFQVMSVLITLLCSFCYRLILDQAERKALLKEREMIHLQTELNFLRSQVSPHFLFNVLNSMIALVRRKSDQLEPIIMQLSRLMRYMLYETDDQPVPLEKEVAYLKSYIELQSFRFGKNILVETKFPNLEGIGYSIAPMLLIPFVENAFKHGTGITERPVIVITLEIMGPKRICFRVVNEISDMELPKDEQPGIGLTNVRRRLELLYPNRHSLYISKGEHAFVAELTIDL